jgi:hypothetical protein
MAYARKSGIDQQLLREILCVLNADQDLIDFPATCANLLQILACARDAWFRPATGTSIEQKLPIADSNIDSEHMAPEVATWGSFLESHHLQGWSQILQWVVEHRETVRERITDRYLRHKYSPKAIPPYDDVERNQHVVSSHLLDLSIGRHPLYAMLWYQHREDNQSTQIRFSLLQAHLFLAYVRLFYMRYSSSGSVENAIQEYESYAGLKPLSIPGIPTGPGSFVVRCIARAGHEDEQKYQIYFSSLPVNEPPEAFAQHVRQQTKGPTNVLSDKIEKRHMQYGDLILKAYQEKDVRIHNVTTGFTRRYFGRVAEHREIRDGLVHSWEDSEEGGTDNPISTVTVCIKKSKKEQDKTIDMDDDPIDEVDADSDLATSDGIRFKGTAATGFSALLQRRPISMANQMLPMSYRNLSVPEGLKIVRHAEDTLLRCSAKLSKTDGMNLLVQILLLTMLSTGRSRRDVKTLCVLWNRSSLADAQAANSSRICLVVDKESHHQAYWRIPIIKPKCCERSMRHSPELKRAEATAIELPDMLGVSRFVLLLNQLRSDSASREKDAHWYIFSRNKYLLKMVNNSIKILFPDERVTSTKVAWFLIFRLIEVSNGDITMAALVARPHLALARARLFYAGVREQRLRGHYEESLSVLNVRPGCKPAPVQSSAKDVDLWIVTRPCPTVEAVRLAVEQLRNQLLHSQPFDSLKSYVQYHNLYTLYTIWACGYATAMRPVIEPLLVPDEIDENGYVRVNDKDSGYGYNARIAVLPDFVQNQIIAYNRHRQSVFLEVSRNGLLRQRMDLESKNCFLLLENKRATQVSPKTIETYHRDYLKFPLNIHRRFVSIELLDRGCLPEAVDWWMGHWHNGEEPWYLYSGLSLSDFREEMQIHLFKLLRDIGFQFIQSKLVAAWGKA